MSKGTEDRAWSKFIQMKIKKKRREENEQRHRANLYNDYLLQQELKRLGAPNEIDGTWDADEEPAPKLDAMDLSGADVKARLASLGVGVGANGAMPVNFRDEPASRQVDPRVAAAIERDRVEAAKRNEQRAKDLAEGAIDFRKATPRDVEDRTRQLLGVHADEVLALFSRRPPPAPPPPKEKDEGPGATDRERLRAESRAQRSLTHKRLTAEAYGRRFSARNLSDLEWQELLRRRGISMANAEPARSPSK